MAYLAQIFFLSLFFPSQHQWTNSRILTVACKFSLFYECFNNFVITEINLYEYCLDASNLIHHKTCFCHEIVSPHSRCDVPSCSDRGAVTLPTWICSKLWERKDKSQREQQPSTQPKPITCRMLRDSVSWLHGPVSTIFVPENNTWKT